MSPGDPGVDGAHSNVDARRPRGLMELAIIVVLYSVYTFTRNQFGSDGDDAAVAFDNALRIISWERALGVYHERWLQQQVLDWPDLVRAFNIYYGSLHFVAPTVVLAALWWKRPDAYLRRRTALVCTTLLALIGFSLFPLMPPRLLCDCPNGSGVDHGFVDTLEVYGGLWSFSSQGMAAVSNQYAAMPSLHFGWALWCALAAQVLFRHRRAKAATFAYPLLTLVAIVVTGNHYVLDAAGGALAVGAGWLVAVWFGSVTARWRPDPAAEATNVDTPEYGGG